MIDLRPSHAHLLFRQNRGLNVLRREMAQEIRDAVAVCGDRDVQDAGCTVAYSRAIDAIMDRYYGRRRGDESGRFFPFILAWAREAWEEGVRIQQDFTRNALKERAPDVLAALEERGKRAS